MGDRALAEARRQRRRLTIRRVNEAALDRGSEFAGELIAGDFTGRSSTNEAREPRSVARLAYIPKSGSLARSFFSSGTSVIVASVSSSKLATDTAFSRATWTTFVGSMMPAWRCHEN